ncbi:hypothetical protein [Alkalihalobacterium alkalinitrilicum]|uniref:hypothetical protein n=1 Tax=Alkalihalobacterium alkalinitrilicum TaxID=427920 RepID=UPI0013039CB0|nr:hypothetical protein [Alkalihalobacterium alkalinitrilicum]
MRGQILKSVWAYILFLPCGQRNLIASFEMMYIIIKAIFQKMVVFISLHLQKCESLVCFFTLMCEVFEHLKTEEQMNLPICADGCSQNELIATKCRKQP